MNKKTIIILTLKKHEDGIWIRRLVKCLHQTLGTKNNDEQVIDVQVKPLEEWLGQGWLVSSLNQCFDNNVMGIVNRVSDAASPPLFKACCAILGAAQIRNIPIVNGPSAYALCGNKWCHHVLFSQAKLKSPRTLAFWNEDGNYNNNASISLRGKDGQIMEIDKEYLLIKPNAGGFGAGIQRIPTTSLILEKLPTFEDSVTLLQSYERPKNNKLYRIWFLQGKVQCGIERHINEENDFTNACAGSCSLGEVPPKPWNIPFDVQEEIEQRLLPLLPDAHCGSVEFLYSQENGAERLYFDLNLLSTLPIRVDNAEGVWKENYDPWMELATAVLDVLSVCLDRGNV